MNYRLVAIEIGDYFKYDTTLNAIGRLARALFRFQYENFPNDAITSERAQAVFNWIMTLAKQNMNPDERNDLLLQFTRGLSRIAHLKDSNNNNSFTLNNNHKRGNINETKHGLNKGFTSLF